MNTRELDFSDDHFQENLSGRKPPNTACTPLQQAQGGLVGLPLRGVRVF